MPQRGELGSRPHGSGDKTRICGCGVVCSNPPGDLRRCERKFVGTVCQTVFRQNDRARSETVCLDNITPRFEIVAVHVFHSRGSRNNEILVAPVQMLSAEVVSVQLLSLKVRAGCTIEHNDLFAEMLEKCVHALPLAIRSQVL